MCGVVGYVGPKDAVAVLPDGLTRMEYRGYDSAGVAVLSGRGVETRKLAGRIAALRDLLAQDPLHGTCGIGHTRWATHGAPTERNAHPHTDCTGTLALVHNGIIENADLLRAQLERAGHRLATETDPETLARLIEAAADDTLEERVIAALARVEGTYGLAVISEADPRKIVVARRGSPLLIGVGSGEYLVASDANAVLAHTRSVVYLGDGDVAVVTPDGYRVFDHEARVQVRTVDDIEWDLEALALDGYPHFMLKEICEQPETVRSTLRGRLLPVVGIVNVVGSTIARESDGGISLHAGPEVGVASTKAFTSQVVALLLLGLHLGRQRGLSVEDGRRLAAQLAQLPELVARTLELEPEVQALAQRYADANNALYLGRGVNFPVALEGALKLKEISYIHAEGYPAAEMKHGPIALIGENMPVVCLAPQGHVYAKVVSNMQEVKARGGRIIAITSEGNGDLRHLADYQLRVPACRPLLSPVLTVIPLQLLAYHIAVLRGCDVDRPRNLAKSVTVE